MDASASTPSPARAARVGRRPSPVWAFFTEVRTDRNRVHARCNFCERQCAGVASRMARHIETKCPRAPDGAVQALKEAAAASVAKRRRVSEAGDALPVVPSDTALYIRPEPALVIAPPQPLPSSPAATAGNATTSNNAVGGGCKTIEAATDVGSAPRLAPSPRRTDALEENNRLVPNSTQVHRNLVLACVLNDVPASFLEDEALVRALATEQLRAEQAETLVLEELANEVKAQVNRSLAGAAIVTLIYRHFERQNGPHDTIVVDQFIGVDDKRVSMLLLEQKRKSETLTSSCCLPPEEQHAIIKNLRKKFSAETAVNLCFECPSAATAFQVTRMTRELKSPTPPADTEDVEATSTGTESRSKPRENLNISLLGSCFLRHSMQLRRELFLAFPSLMDVLGQAILLLHSIVSNTHVDFHLRKQLHHILTTPMNRIAWDFHPRVVKYILAMEQEIREVTVAPSSSQDEFWARLREVDSLLTPFSWMFALSKVKSATSGQFVALWLWMLSLVESSSLIKEEGPDAVKAKSTLIQSTVQHIQVSCSDASPLVCLLLDPRIRGAGLSATGRRHVKSLVVQVAGRLMPEGTYSVTESSDRTRLLHQLTNYSEQAEQFSDQITWEMSNGKDPTLFWKDFSVDATDLSRVAHAVLTFPPVAQDIDEVLNPEVLCKTAWKQTFAVRQIKHQHWKNGHNKRSSGQERPGSRLDELCTSHRELLSPLVPSVAVASLQAGSGELSPLVPADSNVELFALEQIEKLAFLKDAFPDRRGSADTQQARVPLVAIGKSWFAFESAGDREQLACAVQRFVSRAHALEV